MSSITLIAAGFCVSYIIYTDFLQFYHRHSAYQSKQYSHKKSTHTESNAGAANFKTYLIVGFAKWYERHTTRLQESAYIYIYISVTGRTHKREAHKE
jgi:hypothetical protein